MSGQWEVVGKKKDRGSKLPLPKANKEVENKKNDLNRVKIEGIPKSQVQNLYSTNKSNKENKKPQEKSKVQEKSEKKPQKKEKSQDAPKPKAPKSIESALNSVPSGIKSIIEKSLKEAGRDNTQLFFDICLASMATDMGKGLPALGYKFFLQFIATSEPKLVIASMHKHVNLRNSYQNRPNIGLSILWAIGQARVNDLHCGLTVFQELFLPLLDMKNYSRFVAKYLLDLISGNNNDASLSTDEFLLIVDTVYAANKNCPIDLKEQLSKKIPALKDLLFRNPKEKYHTQIDVLLRKIVMNCNKSYQDCICSVLVEMFTKDPTTLSNWNKIYGKNIASSAVLLSYISDNWSSVPKKINKSAFKDLLNSFKVTNEELGLKKRKEEGLNDCIKAVQKINEKMVVKKRSSFPFKTFSILFIWALAGLICIDIWQQGSWTKSNTSKALRDYGVYEFARNVTDKAREGWTWMDSRIEKQFPGYHKAVCDFSTPYIQLFSDLAKIACNAFGNIKEAIVEKYPLVLDTVDSYAPGLIEQSQKAVTNIYATSIFYYNRSVDFLRKEVFIGQLSPENVQRVVIEAFNSTQQKATEYYHWIYEKVQTTIK
ncbi:hypothetical protein NQ318_016366 [Aromia moschata]|uniref:Transmembrane protein 214-A n=1 Tax=Aromia moschata TaxID=1265417 RepID=A0AAV8Z616_9CUCU|nr:hypothetical protein NQ318_016366 [Aromia moschata]